MAYGSNQGREHPSTKGAFSYYHLTRILLTRMSYQQVPDPDCFEDLSLRAAPSTGYPTCRRSALSGHFPRLSTERTFPFRRHNLNLARFLHTFMLPSTSASSTGSGREAPASVWKVRRRWKERQVPAESEEEKEVRYRSSNSQTRGYATQATVHIRSAMLSGYQSPWRKGDSARHYWVDDRFV